MPLTNSVRLIGFCGADTEIKTYGKNSKLLFLPVYTEHWGMPNDQGKRKYFKELHQCVFFGSNAERANKLLMKGSQVHISGSLHYQKKETNTDTEIKAQILVEEFMISSKATMTKEVYNHIFDEPIGGSSHAIEERE